VSSWSLRQRVSALCAVVGLVLAGLALVAMVTATSNRNRLSSVLDRAGPLPIAVQQLNTSLVDQETGVRGYALSGAEPDLAPYRGGYADEQRLAAQIRDMVGTDEPAITSQLDVVQAGARQWRGTVAEPVIAAVQGPGGRAAARALLNDGSRQQFDQLRQKLSVLQAQTLQYRAEAAASARDTGNTLVLLLIIAGALFITAGVALLVVLDRLVTRPVIDLAAQVRAVASGDYERSISSAGSPELRRLAADVDGMRQQIAAELSQVREARSQIEWVNKQLHAQAEELTRSNRDLEQFAYVASHDLQEPLRKVASFCQLLQRRYAGRLDERATQYIAFAVDGAQRMQRLINDLLAFSRIGRLTAGFTDVDLNTLMAEVRASLQSRLDGASVTWSRLPVVEGELTLLTTLFTNLIGNSLKFRRPGVPPDIRISAHRVGSDWEITVRDNGIGIEPEFADKVFVIFQRLHARDAYEGTGIGLAIVKKIVEYHGGRIWLDPDVRDGTAISFTFPVSPTADDVVVPDQPEPRTEEVTPVSETAAHPTPTAGDPVRAGGEAVA
jgi:signal transduction histidine kinase